jgi:serine/threonine protein kinase
MLFGRCDYEVHGYRSAPGGQDLAASSVAFHLRFGEYVPLGGGGFAEPMAESREFVYDVARARLVARRKTSSGAAGETLWELAMPSFPTALFGTYVDPLSGKLLLGQRSSPQFVRGSLVSFERAPLPSAELVRVLALENGRLVALPGPRAKSSGGSAPPLIPSCGRDAADYPACLVGLHPVLVASEAAIAAPPVYSPLPSPVLPVEASDAGDTTGADAELLLMRSVAGIVGILFASIVLAFWRFASGTSSKLAAYRRELHELRRSTSLSLSRSLLDGDASAVGGARHRPGARIRHRPLSSSAESAWESQRRGPPPARSRSPSPSPSPSLSPRTSPPLPRRAESPPLTPPTAKPAAAAQPADSAAGALSLPHPSHAESTPRIDGHVARVGKFLVFTDRVLGYGSSGTIVFEGSLDGRRVAVKRMLRAFFDLASKEIACLLESDEHPSVVSYYAKEEDHEFIYLALYLCSRSLSDLVVGGGGAGERVLGASPARRPSASAASVAVAPLPMERKLEIVRDIARGLQHLHSLGIVHRDLKPQNILVDAHGAVKISDMGLAKRLEANQSSFTASVGGTVGWEAPELLESGRVTRAVDIFALGCIVYYILTDGLHPFGLPFEREMNIRGRKPSLAALERNTLARALVRSMIDPDPTRRLTAAEVLRHPVFWTEERQLGFLKDASDRVEIEKPTDPLVLRFEAACGPRILDGRSWLDQLDPRIISELGKWRKYNGSLIRDLLRVIRNKAHHFRDLSPELKALLGSFPHGYLQYFHSRFPEMFMTVFEWMERNCADEEELRAYFL